MVEEKIKISSINLLSSNSKTKEVKNYIKEEDADIIVLMEFTPKWEHELSELTSEYPFYKFVTRTDNFGIALLSKYEMTASVNFFDSPKPSITGNIRVGNKGLSVVATHPVPPMNQMSFEYRNKHLKRIIENRSMFLEHLVVIGDFNTSSFTNHFNLLIKNGLRDSREGFGLLPTWPAKIGIMQTTLDHCLVSSNIIVLERSVGKNVGSDHLPISAVISLE